MTTLLVGFDSAWTPNNSGALAGLILSDNKIFQGLGPPKIANYKEAENIILQWQLEFAPDTTIILLDQPTIVKNPSGQRPVENVVSSAVSLRYGGVQPANVSRVEMFGSSAPVWPFLKRFGGPANPRALAGDTLTFETYPALAMIALQWTLPNSRPAGRLPKYNPERKKTFALLDWQHVCRLTADAFRERGLTEIVQWLEEVATNPSLRKSDQDRLDACLCLLVAALLAEGRDCLMVGDLATGYIVVPDGEPLFAELHARCAETGRLPSEWLFRFRWSQIYDREVLEVQKPDHELTPVERLAARIAKNKEIEQRTGPRGPRWTLAEIIVRLNAGKQRASYGAVAKLIGVLARGLMNGRPKAPEYSWVVAATGSTRGWPTGYTTAQIHPDCLRQIKASEENIIGSEEELERWLAA